MSACRIWGMAAYLRLLAVLSVSLALLACGGGGGSGSSSTPGGGGGGGSVPTPPSPPAVIAPSISSAPLDAKVIDGGTASFSVSADGSGPLSYQWLLNGADIAGATQASFTTAALKLADSGSKYQVVVKGPGGTVTSNPATLAVTPIAITITRQPRTQSLSDGTPAIFEVEASGSEPLNYQWLRNGAPIVGATRAMYTMPLLTMREDKARFEVEVSNPAGTVRSDVGVLTVMPTPPRIDVEPSPQSARDQERVRLEVRASGSGPLSYQWLRNHMPIAGATSSSYELAADYAMNSVVFRVVVSNAAGSVDSRGVSVTVDAGAATFNSHPLSQTVAIGSSASFSATASGTPTLSYQWQKSWDFGNQWVAIAGARSNSYRIEQTTLADAAAWYRLAVTNAAGTRYSNAAELKVTPQLRRLAGRLGGAGYLEGAGSDARLGNVTSIAADAAGNVFVADAGNLVIRRIGTDGRIALYAGKPATAGNLNGKRQDALFRAPNVVAVAKEGTVYVADGCAIRKIATDGMVSTLAGSSTCGAANGKGAAASFDGIESMAPDDSGNLYVTDFSGAIRKVAADGQVTTFAGQIGQSGNINGSASQARFTAPNRILWSPTGELYVTQGNGIRRVETDGRVSAFAGEVEVTASRPADGYRLGAAFFWMPLGLAIDSYGQLHVLESTRVVRIDRDGYAKTITGFARGGYGLVPSPTPVPVDGPPATATFVNPKAITALPNGRMAIVEIGTLIRQLSASSEFSTWVGRAQASGNTDGAASSFYEPSGLATLDDGSILVADSKNARIRRIDPAGSVGTLAGSSYGCADGNGVAAQFKIPKALALDSAGNAYVADYGCNSIRKVSAAGMVTTLAGSETGYGTADGPGAVAQFKGPSAITINAAGVLYVGDSGNCTIRKISTDGWVTTFAGRQGAYCGGQNDFKGDIDRFVGTAGLAVDSLGRVYVSSSASHTLRRIELNGTIAVVAGAFNAPGHTDDVRTGSRMNSPAALVIDAKDNLYIADAGNAVIRRFTPDGMLSTVLGKPGSMGVALGSDGTINAPRGLALLPSGRLVFISEQAVLGD